MLGPVVVTLLLLAEVEFRLLVGTLPGGGPLLAGLGVPPPTLPPLPLPGTLPGPLGPLLGYYTTPPTGQWPYGVLPCVLW